MSTINNNLNNVTTTTTTTSTPSIGTNNPGVSTNFAALLNGGTTTTTPAMLTLVAQLLQNLKGADAAPAQATAAINTLVNKTMPAITGQSTSTLTSGSANNSIATGMNTPINMNIAPTADGAAETIQSITQPTNGKLTQIGNELIYTPKNRFQGSDSFTYTNSNGVTTTVKVDVATSANTNTAGTGWQTGMMASSLKPTAIPTPVPKTPTPTAPTPAPIAPAPTAPAPAPIAPAPTPAPTPAPLPPVAIKNGATVWGDPHFVGADGEHYDVMGTSGRTYNILSDSGLQLNSTFKSYGGSAATIMDKIGATIGNDQVQINANGALIINGKPQKNGTYQVDGGTVTKSGATITMKTDEYNISIKSQGTYLDIGFKSANVAADGVMPHGLWGQTADGDGKARKGSGMQGGGVLEKLDGTISKAGDTKTVNLYEVKNLFDTNFANFNRFNDGADEASTTKAVTATGTGE